MFSFFVEKALISSTWQKSVRIDVNERGYIDSITSGSSPDGCSVLKGAMIPAVPNLHSHAFQRAMAGLTEVAGNPQDSFWTWRDQMYRLVSKMTPEQVGVIARYLYIGMLKGGYTQVAEFHYLHHAPDGSRYTNDDMCEHLLSAAKDCGIGMTLLPVLYSYSGFGSQPASEAQRRFTQTTDMFLNQHAHLEKRLEREPLVNKGICFHSLRAVNEMQMNEVLHGLSSVAPIHIHISEQQKEVNDCMAWSGQRPVEWLMSHFQIDSRWCLVHATHLSSSEINALSASRAVAGLCPTTEANLGDGIFPGTEYISKNGKWGIGSDSHVSLSVSEELRWFEYTQRLRDQHRNRIVTLANPRVGEVLLQQAATGGAKACGLRLGELVTGARADWLLLCDEGWLDYCPDDQIINRWMFAGEDSQINSVFVAGHSVVENGYHKLEGVARSEFSRVMKELMN